MIILLHNELLPVMFIHYVWRMDRDEPNEIKCHFGWLLKTRLLHNIQLPTKIGKGLTKWSLVTLVLDLIYTLEYILPTLNTKTWRPFFEFFFNLPNLDKDFFKLTVPWWSVLIFPKLKLTQENLQEEPGMIDFNTNNQLTMKSATTQLE